MLSQSLFCLCIKLSAYPIVSAWLFIYPNSKVVCESLKVVSSWKQGVSYGANIDFFGKIWRFKVLIDFILSQNLFVKAWILSGSFLTTNKRSFNS